MRVVIDTNVIISGIFWPGNSKQILNLVRRRKFVYLASQSMLSELRDVLTRPSKSFHLDQNEVEKVMGVVNSLTEVVSAQNHVNVCRDDDDNRVLECAIDGKANFIVSGDRDLLDLKQFQGIRIISVADFLMFQEWTQ